MAQNGSKRVQIGPKNVYKWFRMGFYDFYFLWSKKSKIDQKGQKLTSKWPFLDPKMPIFSKMASFRPRGQKYPKTRFFCPKFMVKTIFDGFWAFLRFFDFLTFWTHVPGYVAPKRSPSGKVHFLYGGTPQTPKIKKISEIFFKPTHFVVF